ncbi:hypothetical protein B0T25DRAFT_552206, partial [Lasiosphaeria hispida]
MSFSMPISVLQLEPKYFHQALFQRLHQQRGNRNPGRGKHLGRVSVPGRQPCLVPMWDKALQPRRQCPVAFDHTHHLSHCLGHRILGDRLECVLASGCAEVVDKVINELPDLLVGTLGRILVVTFSAENECLDIPKEGQWHKPLEPEDCRGNFLVKMRVGVASTRRWRLQNGRRAGNTTETGRHQSLQAISEGPGPGVGFWAIHGESCRLAAGILCDCCCWLVFRPRGAADSDVPM